MFLLVSAQSTSTINTGDIIFQIFSFLFLLAIPAVIILLVVVLRKKNNRLKRVEEKADKLLKDKERDKR
ncbi:hypothetical protein JI667_06700 [Bacillus sp. NTK074B]|uniref:hypothetical protein n=1 Tax=Bacillus sp. NTK074B TaxID=2802174 RepID=UPI001A8C73DC|nr:hypothetical protein [Bacillus sp. NTK074B]